MSSDNSPFLSRRDALKGVALAAAAFAAAPVLGARFQPTATAPTLITPRKRVFSFLPRHKYAHMRRTRM